MALRKGAISFQNSFNPKNQMRAVKNIFITIFAGLMLLTAITAYAVSGDDILGVWSNEERDAKIEIFKCGEQYCGKIVWLKEPNYPAGSKDGTPGTPKLDHRNPDPALKSRPVIGLQIVRDFIFAGDSLWKNGKVYDPKNGKTYRGKMTLVSPAQLNLRGFIGFSFIGRTTSWTR
jgi:uncharacterized protein (DUF2147 family)